MLKETSHLNKHLPCLDAGGQSQRNGNKRLTLIKCLGVACANTYVLQKVGQLCLPSVYIHGSTCNTVV